MSVRRLVPALLLAICAAGAHAQREAHGSSDAYAERGIALAWAVLRGAGDADTSVVIRIVTDAALYPSVALAAVNPFTKAEQVLQAAQSVAGSVDVHIPRSRFVEYPRAEIRLYGKAAAGPTSAPLLTIFYLGVPDTTPEFADRAKLDAYLSDRIERVRNSPKATP